MTFMYQSGEQIRSGDRIEYAGAPGVVESSSRERATIPA